ncbi:hypothetical protein [Streptomyces formicae]|uniref:Uncharacterized protein n=1 Tax=Streptomyces formicae TaxID=1616117 RepID=A0ABY3WF93_9ACTN|nr:hypothetical protein [Streptomyces formicae]UNM10119.1 hypothetical protein J4032_00085 [Streptomyces formicae]
MGLAVILLPSDVPLERPPGLVLADGALDSDVAGGPAPARLAPGVPVAEWRAFFGFFGEALIWPGKSFASSW